MKSIIAMAAYVVALLSASTLLAQTEKLCFTNKSLCQASSAWEKFPWVMLPDTIAAGALRVCDKDGVFEIRIPVLITNEPDGIPPEKTVLEGTTKDISLVNNVLSMTASMKDYNQFPFQMTIQLTMSDVETLAEFQKQVKKKRK